jgi:hypothetical protein
MLSLSGTGIITITPPATNTNRAITLPDAAGALVVSGTTPSLNGITFPASQSASAGANTLDDYEEGTWTPGQGSGLTVVGAYSSSGQYTKIGRSVTIKAVVSGATSVACTANSQICTGLPFTTNEEFQGSLINASRNFFNNVGATGTIVQNSTAFTATSTVEITLTYFV